MTYLGLFEGIGGGSIAATLAEFEILATVEIDDYCNEVLKKNFPNVPKHKDIKDFSGVPFAGRTDIVFGGFPCQPFSTAGQRLGENDDRALW